MLLCSKV